MSESVRDSRLFMVWRNGCGDTQSPRPKYLSGCYLKAGNCVTVLYCYHNYYCPHTKYGGGNVFVIGVLLFTGEGGCFPECLAAQLYKQVQAFGSSFWSQVSTLIQVGVRLIRSLSSARFSFELSGNSD